MRRFLIALVAIMAYCGTLSAQVSIYDVVPENGMKEFENDLKYQAVDAEYYSDAVYRAERRMTQQQLADAVGVSRQTVNAIESGRFIPSTVLALKVARLFGKPVEEVFLLEEGD